MWHQPRNLLNLTGSYNTGNAFVSTQIYKAQYLKQFVSYLIIEKFAVSHYIKNITKAQFTEECVTWC